MNPDQNRLVVTVKEAIDKIKFLLDDKNMELQKAENFKNEMNPAEDMMRVFQGAVDFDTVLIEYQQKLRPFFDKIQKLDELINQK